MTTRDRTLRRKYGISAKQYDAMLSHQGGRCAICGRAPKTRRLHTDHDHATGRVRGALCYRCNRYCVSKNTRQSAWKVYRYLDSDFDARNLQ